METTLHRQLKERYADDPEQTEVKLGRFRIDAIAGDELVEIQHGPLAAIRDKVAQLLKQHKVRIVKPLIVKKQLVKRRRKSGKIIDRRQSPKRGSILDVFHELVYFTRVFPHRHLTLEVPLVEVEEWRYPGHGKRRRRRSGDFVIEDQKLLACGDSHIFRAAADLFKILPADLPSPFGTSDIATLGKIDRWVAQRIAYCLRKTGAAKTVGKRGNAVMYEANVGRKRRRKRAA